jgi:CubicO group peptidase (beta-lactamase class C family)
MKSGFRFLLVLSILVLILSGYTQTDNRFSTKIVRLEKVKTVERDMDRGDTHTYQIKLDDQQFFYARVEQRGIDVVIRIKAPDGRLIEEVDSPTGDRGTETVVLVTEESGDYTLEIAPFDPLTKSGQYVMTIEKIAQAATTIPRKVDQLFVPWDKSDSPGAAVAVVKEGEIIFQKGYGMANLEYDVPITRTTVFHMASVSKQFTAFAIAKLAQEGKISLNDDIRTYLPEVPDFGKTISISHLIHHTSGLRDQWNLLMLAGWRLDDVITREHILRLISRQKELNFDPGEQMMYCNTGYTLMAEIVARVSDKSFHEWTRENIFDPLDMKRTLFYDDHEKIVRNRAYSYGVGNTDGFKKTVLSYANVGATSLFTTSEDLAKWAMNFDNPVVGNKELFTQMEEKAVLNDGDTIAYAFGQGIGTYKGLRMIGHSGGDAGYRTYLGRFPEHRFSVMVLSNLGSFNPRGVALKVADIFLKDLLIEPQQEEERRPDYVTIEVDPEILEQYAGLYDIEPERRFQVRRNGRQMNIRFSNNGWENIYPVDQMKFLSLDGQSSFIFEQDESGEVTHVLITQNNKEFSAIKIQPYKPNPAELAEYSGSYFSDELLTSYTVTLRDSVLCVQHQRHSDFILEPESKEVFNAEGFFGQFRFERNQDNQISGFRINFGRVQKLLFTLQ